MPNANAESHKILFRVTSILTDLQFWVPVVVLIAGLLLLRFIH
jgi:hypothetical protein